MREPRNAKLTAKPETEETELQRRLGAAVPDPTYAALVQVANDNSEMDGTASDGGQVKSARKAVRAAVSATKALDDDAAAANEWTMSDD